MTETQLQTAVVKLARMLGFLVYHTHDSRRSEPGFPDLTMVKEGRLLFTELKTATGKLTDDQLMWIDALMKTDNEVYVWRPADWDNGTIVKCLMRGER